MVAKFFLALTDYSIFRRIMWKPIYEWLAKKIKIDDWQFMNYGYAPGAAQPALFLQPQDEINRYPIQLYHFLAQKTIINRKEILGVGSGRGGGSCYIMRYLHPSRMTGMDIAFNAVQWASGRYKEKNLEFIQGNAEKLPFADESFDVVINVESCHAYASVPRFLAEVRRVLRPAGFFLCADLRSVEGMDKLKSQLMASGLQLLSDENITQNVVMAIERESAGKEQRIKKHVAKWLQPWFSQFAGTKGSAIHRNLETNSLQYYCFVLQK